MNYFLKKIILIQELDQLDIPISKKYIPSFY